jgi:hypothetical protein
MNKHIEVKGDAETAKIPVRRRSRGRITEPLNVTIPVELAQTINGILVTSGKTRSALISELIEKGLKG